MRPTTIGTSLAMLALAGCGTDGAGQQAAELPEDRTFVSTSVSEGGEPRPLVDGTEVRLTFDGGELRAHAGCNHLFGNVRLQDGRLQVNGLGGTEIGCSPELAEQDEWLSGFLTGEPAVELDDETLVLAGGETTIVLADSGEAEPDRALEETRWLVDTVLDGDVASSVPRDAAAHLTFAAGGEVRGNAGCNSLDARYTATGSRLDVEEITTTNMSCGQHVDRFERTVLDVLAGEPSYEIDGDRLTLTGGERDRRLRLTAE
ncbi:Heat shock protein HslJ [Haloechinothrix alba]|uniref:Heat shock protein HslJ n=2 Tax=Haloechinothrix alba TaxID=664784 RepID=A0A238V372_9PSEU|nr:Heat shock protein HslJ [Haloechinothrix alba]